jgi:hypothetical protein
MFASYFSRDKIYPMLLLRGEHTLPCWIHPEDCVRVSIGDADLTCCQRNHHFEGLGVVPCDKGIIRSILKRLIDTKIKSMIPDEIVEINTDFKTPSKRKLRSTGRWSACLKKWWLRGLSTNTSDENNEEKKEEENLAMLKKNLQWHKTFDKDFFDCFGNSILMYAVTSDNLNAVRVCVCVCVLISKHTHTIRKKNNRYERFLKNVKTRTKY